MVRNPTTGAILDGKFYFMANTGIANLKDSKIADPEEARALAYCSLAAEVITDLQSYYRIVGHTETGFGEISSNPTSGQRRRSPPENVKT